MHVANTAQSMARGAHGTDAAVFNKVAMVCMGVMAAAAVVQMLRPLLRDLNNKHDAQNPHRHGRHR